MADHPSTREFEDVPLDEARRMSRGSRMTPEFYNALQQKIPSLDHTATLFTISEGTRPNTMKNRDGQCKNGHLHF